MKCLAAPRCLRRSGKLPCGATFPTGVGARLASKKLGYRRYYIQSALSLDTDEKREQEKRSLRLIGDGFKKIVIVNKVMKPYMDDDGILTMGLFDFLPNPDGPDS